MINLSKKTVALCVLAIAVVFWYLGHASGGPRVSFSIDNAKNTKARSSAEEYVKAKYATSYGELRNVYHIGDIDSNADIVANKIHQPGDVSTTQDIYAREYLSVLGDIKAKKIDAVGINTIGNIEANVIDSTGFEAIGDIDVDRLYSEMIKATGTIRSRSLKATTFSLDNRASSKIDFIIVESVTVTSRSGANLPFFHAAVRDDGPVECSIGKINGVSVELTDTTADEIVCEELILHGKSRVKYAKADRIILNDDSVVDYQERFRM